MGFTKVMKSASVIVDLSDRGMLNVDCSSVAALTIMDTALPRPSTVMSPEANMRPKNRPLSREVVFMQSMFLGYVRIR